MLFLNLHSTDIFLREFCGPVWRQGNGLNEKWDKLRR
jgi:hypothetical protein